MTTLPTNAASDTDQMASNRTSARYREHVIGPDLERRSLFEASLGHESTITTVPYPGSSAHLTSPFHIPHVVHVNRSVHKATFFADEGGSTSVTTDRGHLRQAPYSRFAPQDCPEPLPLREQIFNPVLSLYAEGASRPSTACLWMGGVSGHKRALRRCVRRSRRRSP